MIVFQELKIYYRVRPGATYFSMLGTLDRLWVGCWWDDNCYEEALVKEFVDEFYLAALHYLADAKAYGLDSEQRDG